MSLLDSYQDSTDQALSVMAKQPLTPESPKPKHSGWTTVPRAVAGAVSELSGNALDVSGAIAQTTNFPGGEMLDFSGGEMGNMSASQPDQQSGPYTKKSRVDQFKKLNTEGFDFRSGKPAYQFAHDLRPDPITAGTAENIVFGLTKGLTKAIGAGVVLGPMAGAGVFGTSEGMTAAEDLANQGVDKSTRTKVGAVTGVLNTVGVALPVVGKNLAQTAALVAVGGPGSFIAQQAASKEILKNADYGEIATQYDPLDPVGLAVSTLVPAGFAVWARGSKTKQAAKALRFNDPALDAHATTVEQQHGLPAGLLVAIKNAGEKSNSNQVSPKGAQGVMQFIPSTWKQYGKGDPTNPADSIDAAGRYFADLIKRYDGNVDAAITEYNGGVKQARGVADGKAPTAKETIAYLGRVKQAMAQPAKEAPPEVQAPKPTQEHIDAAMVQNLTVARDAHEEITTVYHGSPHKFDQFDMSKIGTGEGAQAYGHGLYFADAPDVARGYAEDLTKSRVQSAQSYLDKYGGNVDDAILSVRGSIDRLKGLKLTPETGSAQQAKRIAFDEEKLTELLAYKNQGSMNAGNFYKVEIPTKIISKMLDWDKPLSEQGAEVQAALRRVRRDPDVDLLQGMIDSNAVGGALVKAIAAPKGGDMAGRSYASELLKAQGITGIRYLDGNSRGAGGTSNYVLFDDSIPKISEINGKPTATKARTQTVKADPDMPVAVKDDGTHVTAAEQLDAIKQQAQEGTDTELGALDAPLLKVAAECLLS